MNSSEATMITESDKEWIVEDVTRRVSWTDKTAECRNCESSFDLDTTHYYATLRPRRSTHLTEESREIVFCSRPCVDDWSHS